MPSHCLVIGTALMLIRKVSGTEGGYINITKSAQYGDIDDEDDANQDLYFANTAKYSTMSIAGFGFLLLTLYIGVHCELCRRSRRREAEKYERHLHMNCNRVDSSY